MTATKNGRPQQTPQQMRATLLRMAGRMQGCTRSDIHDRWDARTVAYAMVEQMVAAGELFAITYKRGTWYFASAQAAAAFKPPGQGLAQYPQHGLEQKAAPAPMRAIHIHRRAKLYPVDDLMQHVTPRRMERTPLHLPGTHLDKPLDAHAPAAELPARKGKPGAVRVTQGPHWSHDPRYQCAPGEKPHGAGFAAAGIGRDITTGQAWDSSAPAAAARPHRIGRIE